MKPYHSLKRTAANRRSVDWALSRQRLPTSTARPMRTVLAIFALTLVRAATSCYVPPPYILRDPESLVSEATSIVVVSVAPDAAGGCALQIERVIKGLRKPLAVECHLPKAGDWMTDFNRHTAKRFWQQDSGRLGVNGDCSVISPAFEVGHTYVLLLGVRPDTKQFEEVTPEDRWLSFIEAHIH